MENRTTKIIHLSQKGGCAAKIPAEYLRSILSKVNFPATPDWVMIDGKSFDDASIIKLSNGKCIIQTLDFFTPIIDDPFVYGQIAAANSISDVYAMGGVPLTCMGIMAFPHGELENEIVSEMLSGSLDIISKSGAYLVGGHTVDNPAPLLGFSVTGEVEESEIWSNAGARVGDVIVLTKAIGTGTATAGVKRGALTTSDIAEEIASMIQLNDVASKLNANSIKVNAATDITGFGLSGHMLNVAKASGVTLEIACNSIPLFRNTLEHLKAGFLTKAHKTNFDYVQADSNISELRDSYQKIVTDPQTSGGLLLSVPETDLKRTLEIISPEFKHVRTIGKVINRSNRYINFVE